MAALSRPGSLAAGRRPRGFTYLGILLAIALLGIALAAVGTMWTTVVQREREAQLLFAGDAFRAAISSYYTSGPAPRLPQSLEELVQDERQPLPRRHLRRIYLDPMTGRADWELLRDPDGGIFGVVSRSQRAPLKRANFSDEDAGFVDAENYSGWRFEFSPARRQRRAAP